jgi:putative two-component system response regulator
MQKRKILIVDDSAINREILHDMLSDNYQILEAANSVEALNILRENENEILLMLLDIIMPVMDGFELLALMNQNGWIKRIPVIMISAEDSQAFVDKAYDLGVCDYISRPFNERTVLHRVNSTIMMAVKQNELSDMVANEIYKKERNNRLMIGILSNIVEFRNGESGLHVLHIRTITEMILRRLLEKTDRYPIARSDISLICNASSLHDIGKISVPDEILNKPGRLTPEEYEIMKKHAIEGARMLSAMQSEDNEEPLITIAYQICRWHHERYDGKGYPDGLKGEAIPIVAQVVSLADVYDALTSERVYKAAYSHEKAVQMILAGECGAFNPLLLECLLDISDDLKNRFYESPYEEQEEKMTSAVEEIKGRDGLDVSAQAFRQLEHERKKNRFYANRSGVIEFEYTVTPEMLVLSEWSSKYLGLPIAILNPKRDGKWNQIFSHEQQENLTQVLRDTTGKNPIVEQECELNIDGTKRFGRVIAMAMWTKDAVPKYEGAVGKFLDVYEKR